MEDEAKTKRQLIDELEQLRSRLESLQSGPGDEGVDILTGSLENKCNISRIIPHALCTIDTALNIISANPNMESMLGYGNGELSGKNLVMLMGQPFRQDFPEFVIRASQTPAGNYEAELVRKDGINIWAAISATPIAGRKGEFLGALVSLTEITDYKRMFEELLLGSRLLDSASDSIFLRDLEGNFVYVNEAAYKTRGFTREELLNASIYQVVAPEYHQLVEDKVKELFKKGKASFEAAHLKKDGSTFPVEIHMSIVEMGGKKLILSIARDIAQRKKIEAELMRALKMESVAMMAGGVAGQFNSLLTRITGNLAVMMSEMEPRTQLYHLLQETEKSASRTRDLARHLLAFSHKGTPVKKTASIGTLIKDTADFVLSGANAWCNFFIAEDLHQVELDEGQFSQALSNIILNASQAMPNGGVINISARNLKLEDNEISNLKEGSYVEISVEDRGQGIRSAYLQRVFDPYFTTREGQLGLGLSIAYTIISSHGGTITAASEEGKGSTFRIYLPAAESKATKEAEKKPARPDVKMLIVDDESVIRNVGKRMLNRLGYNNVEFASNGIEAVQKYGDAVAHGDPYNVVIADLTLPGGMGGREVVKSILNIDPKANIIISSGYFDAPLLNDFQRYGVKGVLAKPYRLEELKLLLQDISENKTA